MSTNVVLSSAIARNEEDLLGIVLDSWTREFGPVTHDRGQIPGFLDGERPGFGENSISSDISDGTNEQPVLRLRCDSIEGAPLNRIE